jgi:hypothetical protein
MRQTNVGAVRTSAGLGIDESSSHLHPTVRVTWLGFTFDKDVKLRDALGAIAEARAICANGCSVVGQADAPIYSARVSAMPQSETEKQLVRQLALANPFIDREGAEKARAADRATFTIMISYRKTPQAFSFETTPIDGMKLTVTDPIKDKSFDKTIAGAGGKVVTLPAYKPL